MALDVSNAKSRKRRYLPMVHWRPEQEQLRHFLGRPRSCGNGLIQGAAGNSPNPFIPTQGTHRNTMMASAPRIILESGQHQHSPVSTHTAFPSRPFTPTQGISTQSTLQIPSHRMPLTSLHPACFPIPSHRMPSMHTNHDESTRKDNTKVADFQTLAVYT